MEDILLVDDEQPVLEGLVAALDWAEYGFKRIHTAQDAQEALQILQKNRIDLLISDILMPGMSGLDMLRIVRSRFPDTHCVLLSAHSKFEYAREALTLGVENYLLKPIDITELRETVYRTVKNIDKTNSITHDLYDRNILVRWLYGRISVDELMEHSRYTRLNVLLRRYRVLVVKTPEKVEPILHHLEEQLTISYAAHPLQLNDHTGVVLIGGREISSESVLDAIRPLIIHHPEITLVCGTQATGSSEVAQSMADAQYALEFCRLSARTGYLSCDDADCAPPDAATLSALEDLLQPEASAEQVQQWVTRQLMQLPSAKHPPLYAQLCLRLNHLMHENGAVPRQKSTFQPLTPPFTPERIRRQLIDAIQTARRSIHSGMDELSPITRRVLKYVSENLNGSVSIKQFAELARMNATYIGRLFKDEMGVYFSDYVCMTRINKAKSLLESTQLSVGDIARQVGIYDVSYFTQCFKKQERTSHMKYRQQYLARQRAEG